MTREEAKAIIRKEYLCVDRDCDIERNCDKCDLMMPSKEPILQAYKMAIQALEQEPCEDAISRQAVLDLCDSTDSEYKVVHFKEDVERLPSVTPQYSDAEIQKMQELESAEVEKAYELGKEN